MQRTVDADLSTVKNAFSGSAPMPLELFNRFESATGMTVIEGYGLTEATCLVSCNPPEGEKKVGSVGVPFPYTDVRIIKETPGGPVDCDMDEVGEICISNPGVFAGNTYTEAEKNAQLYHYGKYLRTGDLGRLDADGYLWITGRAKDLIIRGGHNIDPAEIEEALMAHNDVAIAGAIGQPDAPMSNWSRAAPSRARSCATIARSMSTSARRSRNMSRCWTNCPRPPSARCSSPTCASARSPASITRRWTRPGWPRASRKWWTTRSAASWRSWKRPATRMTRR